MTETLSLLDDFRKKHLKEKRFYRNTCISIGCIYVAYLSLIFLFNIKWAISSINTYTLMGLAALIIGFAFSLREYFKQVDWLKAIDGLEKDSFNKEFGSVKNE